MGEEGYTPFLNLRNERTCALKRKGTKEGQSAAEESLLLVGSTAAAQTDKNRGNEEKPASREGGRRNWDRRKGEVPAE